MVPLDTTIVSKSSGLPIAPSLHEAVVKMFEKHDRHCVWTDEDIEATKQEIDRLQNGRSILLDDLKAFEKLFLTAREAVSVKSRMAMYCGKEQAVALFDEWEKKKEELTEDERQELIKQAVKKSRIPECFSKAVQFDDELNAPISPPDTPPHEVVNLGDILFKQTKKMEQEENAALIYKLQANHVANMGEFQPDLENVLFLAFACALDRCWEHLDPKEMESQLKRVISSTAFDDTFHGILNEFLQEEGLLAQLKRLQASPMDEVRAFLKEENFHPDAIDDTCVWIAKDLKALLEAHQRGGHYTQALTPAEILEQFHKEVRCSCNKLSLSYFFDTLEKLFPGEIVDAILGDWYLIGTDIRDGRAFLTHERKQQLLEYAQSLHRHAETTRLEDRVRNRLSRGDLLPSPATVAQQFPEIAADPDFCRSIPVDFLVKQALVAQSIKNPARFAVTDSERFAFKLLGMNLKRLEEVKRDTYRKIAAAVKDSGQFVEDKLKTQTAEKIKEEIEQIAFVEKLRLMEVDIRLAPQVRTLVRFYSGIGNVFKPLLEALIAEIQQEISNEHGITLLSQNLRKVAQNLVKRLFRHRLSQLINAKADAIKMGLNLPEKDFVALLLGMVKEPFSSEKLIQEIRKAVTATVDNRVKWTKKWNNPWEFEMQQGLNDEQECLVEGICWAITSRLSILEQKQPELTHEQQKHHFTIQPCDRFYQATYQVNPRLSQRDQTIFLPKMLSDKLGIFDLPHMFEIEKSNQAELGQMLQSEAVQQAEGVCHLSLHGGKGADHWGHAIYMRCDLKRWIFYFFDPNGGKSKSFKPLAGESSEQAMARMLTCAFEWLDAEYPDLTSILGYTYSTIKT